jgi:hypothetical protein
MKPIRKETIIVYYADDGSTHTSEALAQKANLTAIVLEALIKIVNTYPPSVAEGSLSNADVRLAIAKALAASPDLYIEEAAPSYSTEVR